MKKLEFGFVLGGGGARVYPQLGAINVLEKAGIKPSYISGTSMGAVNAVLLGMGLSTEDLYAFYHNTHATSFFEIVIKRKYFLTNKKLGLTLKKYCEKTGYFNLEDLPIKTSVCVTDVKTKKPVFLTKGNICEAVRASSSAYMAQLIKVKDETIKKQVCEQTGQEYIEGMEILLNDGCFTANVPYEALDLLIKPNKNCYYYDLCFDVVTYPKTSPIKSLKEFYFKNFMRNQKRKDIFISTKNGCYMDFDCGLGPSTFETKYLNKGFKHGQSKTTIEYIKKIKNDINKINIEPELER